MVSQKKNMMRKTTIITLSVKYMLPTIFSLYTCLLFSCFLFCSAKDTITFSSLVSDDRVNTLISAGEKFELGFFTPGGSTDNRRYVGIWYYRSNPQTVVWVANRDNPVSGTDGVFAMAEDGNLKVLDGSGKPYWWTNLETSSPMNRTAKLLDTGNLIVSHVGQENHTERVLWQSFENPTDTFVPGMKMDESLALTSWTSYDDPTPGNFTFRLDQGVNQFIIWKRSLRYWKSGVSGKIISSDQMSFAIFYLLSNFTSSFAQNDSVPYGPYLTSSLYKDTRLIMNFSGQIQYLKWDTEKIWSLIWAEPRDRCSVYNACGNFASCNSKNDIMCKCLPGFKPSMLENWNSGDFSGGCTRKSILCDKNSESDTFLSLKMMKVGNPDTQFNAKNELECKIECLDNCHCQAYSYEAAEITRRGGNGSSVCWIWSEDLNNLQEEYNSGRNLFVRVAVSDTGINTLSISVKNIITS
jgi:hypothetical protein